MIMMLFVAVGTHDYDVICAVWTHDYDVICCCRDS